MLAILVLIAAAESTYKLGGPRQVVATVATAEGDHVVRVRMLPVTAFDGPTNERVARQLAERYALHALARHLAPDRGAQVEVAGGRVAEAGRDGKAYALTYRVPEKGAVVVGVGGAGGPAPPGRKRFAFDTPFFTRKRDLIETGRLLGESLAADLAALEKGVTGKAAPGKDAAEAALLRLAELEEKGEGHWKKLRTGVAADKLLLSDERDEALAALAASEAAWTRLLAARARKFTREDAP